MATAPGHVSTVSDLVSWTNTLLCPEQWSHWWYRGHGTQHDCLCPQVLRASFKEDVVQTRNGAQRNCVNAHWDEYLLNYEREMNRLFGSHGAAFYDKSVNLVELYFLARHHGLPSRLLDWTTNPLAALFFAATTDLDKDGEIIAAMPHHFSRHRHDEPVKSSTVSESYNDSRSQAVLNTVEYLFGDRDRQNLFENLDFDESIILPILPDALIGRISRQESRFSLHMPGCHSLEKARLQHLIIPSKSKPDLILELRSLAIRWDTLFPDLDHVAREIRAMYCGQSSPRD